MNATNITDKKVQFDSSRAFKTLYKRTDQLRDAFNLSAGAINKLDDQITALEKNVKKLKTGNFWLKVAIGYLLYCQGMTTHKLIDLETKFDKVQVEENFEKEVEKYVEKE